MKSLLAFALLTAFAMPAAAASLSDDELAAINQVCMRHLLPAGPASAARATSRFQPGFEDCDKHVVEWNARQTKKAVSTLSGQDKSDFDALKAAKEKAAK